MLRGPIAILEGVAALALCAAVLGGCASAVAPRSTRLADADLALAVADLRDQLAGSGFLRERGSGSPEARLVLRRIENLSTDRISPAEQWTMAARIVSSPGMQELLGGKAVSVQLPPEKVALLSRGGLDFPALAPEDRPTHLMRAQIASGTRAASLRGGRDADIRKEYYLLSFEITDLDGREVLWQGTTELAREAEGRLDD